MKNIFKTVSHVSQAATSSSQVVIGTVSEIAQSTEQGFEHTLTPLRRSFIRK